LTLLKSKNNKIKINNEKSPQDGKTKKGAKHHSAIISLIKSLLDGGPLIFRFYFTRYSFSLALSTKSYLAIKYCLTVSRYNYFSQTLN